MTSVYEFQATSLEGEPVDLAAYRGQVLLIVNTASECGFTPQYTGLQALHDKYGSRGFAVLGFPCNQFGGQEPGGSQEIASFCTARFGVTFPLFEKVEVNGTNAHPLWQYLKSAAPGMLGTEAVKWNFTKFLVGREGQVLARYAPNTAPADLASDIESALAG